ILCRMIFRRINLALVSLLLAVTATCASATDALSQVRNMPEAPRIPASTLKILTAWLAIDHWGLDHRFTTDFFLDDGQVLWVKGYGDPMQVSEEIERIAVRLKAKGLTGLNGIRLDGSYFASMAARTAPTPMMPPWRHWLPTSTR
ncbi:D-alanyl-D-alanine carboxypeptidase, partial [Thiolapillus sp.]|uniref:D-alanyl-D-alanine carboxypeptidase n=1 Tax=Thiolapillus sp. TaxID=2017437 RepID=UPI003AF5C628